MTAGMPGTGIGTIFYMLLVIFLPLRELYLTLRGRSSLARWKAVLAQWTIVVGVLLALRGEGYVLKKGYDWLLASSPGNSIAQHVGTVGTAVTIPMIVATPFIILGTLWAGIHTLRLVLKRNHKAGAIVPAPVPTTSKAA